MMMEFRTWLKEINAAMAHHRAFSGHFLNETSRRIMRRGDMNGALERQSSGNFPLPIPCCPTTLPMQRCLFN